MELRRGKLEDTEKFIKLLQEVRSGMAHKEWFYLDPPEDVREMLASGTMQLWVAMEDDRMAAAFSVIYPGLSEMNYGYDLEYSQEELRNVVCMDTVAVHPDFRGQKLQQRLMRMAEQEIVLTGNKILLCTVHPDNRYSLQNVLNQGYTIQKKLVKYGSVRYILMKNLEG